MPDFYCLIERNPWEGDAWRFYFPADADGKRVADAIAAMDQGDYRIARTTVPEREVDRLVAEHGDDTGYLRAHNKLGPVDADRFDRSRALVSEHPGDALLYKGRLLDYVRTPAACGNEDTP